MSEAPALCVAGGSGLTPLKAMLQQAVHGAADRDVVLVFGARQHDLYCLDEFDSVGLTESLTLGGVR